MAHRDRISQLPEELLLRILSLLPAKDVVVTMVLSKRWKFLWMFVPTLEYDHAAYQDAEGSRFSRFVYSSLLLHEAPVLECLRLKLYRESGTAVDIGVCVRAAVKRSVRELDIDINTPWILTPVTLPWSLSAGGCKTLVTLKLSNMTLLDVSSSLPASFPSLKILSLVKMKYPSEEFINKVFASCPVLEDLAVEQCSGDNVTVIAVQIPSLKFLSLRKRTDIDEEKLFGFVIDTPSLVSFDIVNHCGVLCIVESNMPEIVYVNIDINYCHPWNWKMLSSLSSVKQLELCLTSSKYHPIRTGEQRPCWNEPSLVPECVLKRLETVEWVKYEGTEEEKEAVAFIFRNARCLKKATISSLSTDPIKKLEMLKELSFLSRCSSTCHLTFD